MENNLSKVFRTFEQRDKVLTGLAHKGYVRATPVLPEASVTEPGTVYLLTKFCRDYVPGIIYICNEIDGKRMWMDITIAEIGHLPKPTDFWKRITKDAIILHWESPESVVDPTDPWKNATWDYEVIVRKFGKEPQTPEDGEILGYSTVRNQYDDGSDGFIVPLDEDDPDYDYHYAVFACTRSNVFTRSDVLRGSWTWPEIKEQVNAGTYKRAFRVGDVIPMPDHALFGVLHAVIVDFDRAPNTSNESTNSIVFQIKEVLGNMSFDNAELEYARTSDTVFMRNKQYWLKRTDGELEEINVVEVRPSDASIAYIGGSIASWRQRHISIDYVSDEFTDDNGRIEGYPIVYSKHPSLLYWAESDDQSHDDIDRWERWMQSCIHCGDSNWHYSNIRDWLSLRLGLTKETYLEYTEKPTPDDDTCHCADDGCSDGCNCKHSMKRWWNLPRERIANFGDLTHSTEIVDDVIDTNTYWAQEELFNDNDWTSEINGWFSSVDGDWHNIAPGSLNSARYIDKIPFQDGWPVEFTDLIYQHRCTTITDEINWRYMRGGNQNTTPTYDAMYISRVRPIIAQGTERFWLPSYEEIYGERPVLGYNGEIDADSVRGYSEGEQFAYYKQHPEDVVKTDKHGRPMAWYLRSCDPTTVGRVFVVRNYLPEEWELPEFSVPAHREGDPVQTRAAAAPSEDDMVGPAPCFIIRAD